MVMPLPEPVCTPTDFVLSAVVPPMSVPIRLPWTRTPDPPIERLVQRLALVHEMTFLAPPIVPPTVVPLPLLLMETPKLLPMAFVPEMSVPM